MSIFSKKFLQQLMIQVGILVSALAPEMQASIPDTQIQLPSIEASSCISQVITNFMEHKKNNHIPEFTPFDWSTQPTYIIQGTGCNYISGIGSTGCVPATFVIDPPNKRLLLVLGNQKQYILENESFITNVVPGCARVLKSDGTNFTFADQVAGYLNVLSMPKSTTKKSQYFGLAADVASCQDKIAVELHLKNGYLSQFNFAQMFPIGPECAYVTGYIKFDKRTIDTTSSTDPYFVLDAACINSAPSFCSELFYPGNPCQNCIDCQQQIVP